MTMINSAGVFIELIAACLIAIILAFSTTRGPGVFFSTNGYGAGTRAGAFWVHFWWRRWPPDT